MDSGRICAVRNGCRCVIEGQTGCVDRQGIDILIPQIAAERDRPGICGSAGANNGNIAGLDVGETLQGRFYKGGGRGQVGRVVDNIRRCFAVENQGESTAGCGAGKSYRLLLVRSVASISNRADFRCGHKGEGERAARDR